MVKIKLWRPLVYNKNFKSKPTIGFRFEVTAPTKH
jgi:hypothetical protein